MIGNEEGKIRARECCLEYAKRHPVLFSFSKHISQLIAVGDGKKKISQIAG
jgi:hypothetical protein